MNHIIWNQLLSISDKLNESEALTENTIEKLIAQLESINIAHERSFDPAENFEEYVAVTLCQAINKVLKTGNS
ncbi:hypothetical protein ACM9HF_17715 [Colwellia sp. RE-S-Sl-9]